MHLVFLCFMNIILMINGEYGSYNQYVEYNNQKNYHRDPEIPSLKSLFNYTYYRDKANKTSPCIHDTLKRDIYCEEVSYFDAEGYERSLQDTRNLILSRLNLDAEPDIKINENTLSFLDQLENKILNEDRSTIVKTKYDVKNPQNKIFNTMHEAAIISPRCSFKNKYLDRDSSRLCITFQIPVKNLINVKSAQSTPNSVELWLFVRTATTYESNIDENFHLEISNNHKHSSSVIINDLNDGWNKINITNIFKINYLNDFNKDSVYDYTLMLKCFHECSIGFTDREMTDFYDDSVNILINNYPGKKPLLSINIEEIDDMDKKRNKRNSNSYQSYNRASEGHHTKFCTKNYQDKDRECCLNRYFVNFNTLKWSQWIVSPVGYSANYCSGKCNDPKSFNYGSEGANADLKQKLNENAKLRNYFDSSELLETCCHPVSMDSLVVTYLAGNGSLVKAVLPNMIITGCGCS